jgi:NodT family efflux transporter outer membrane factor (OMF) lipoprotein
MRYISLGQILLLNVLLWGCTVGPQYEQTPEMDIPEEWHSHRSEGMFSGDPECFLWWESLNDPILNSLIRRAAAQNLDLFIAGTRILEARRERLGKTADLYPHVDASLTTGHLYYSKDALVKGVLERAVSSRCIHHVKRNVNFFEVGFDANWEIDLFGVTKHQLNAMQARVEAAEETLYDIWVILSAEIARNYIELRSLQQRQQLLIRNIEAQEDSVRLIQELLRIGATDNLDFLHAEEQLNILIAQKPLLDLAIAKTIHRLSILLGYSPGELFAELCHPSELPLLPCEKPLGLPSELLRRRPDIRRAERNLAAATELEGSAVAGLFPRISLFGFVGTISTQLKSLLDRKGATWLVAPQVLMPIFNSKLLTQDVDLAKIQTQQALFEYQKTVLEALEEVENAIASFHYQLDRHHSLGLARGANQKAYQLTLQLYQRGIKDYLEVQIATRSLLASEETYIQSQTELLLHYISLYKALGGGWDLARCLPNQNDSSQCPSSCEESP